MFKVEFEPVLGGYYFRDEQGIQQVNRPFTIGTWAGDILTYIHNDKLISTHWPSGYRCQKTVVVVIEGDTVKEVFPTDNPRLKAIAKVQISEHAC